MTDRRHGANLTSKVYLDLERSRRVLLAAVNGNQLSLCHHLGLLLIVSVHACRVRQTTFGHDGSRLLPEA